MQRLRHLMLSDRRHDYTLADGWLAMLATPLMIPVILFTAAGFQVPLTLLLAPLAALTVFRAPARLRNLVIACLVAGLISIAMASLILNDPFRPRYLLSLLLIMTSPLYFFLGREVGARSAESGRLLGALALVATVFVVALAIEAIVTGSQVRWYIGDEGFTVLNVDFLGLPLYGSFGVFSLASLLVVQTFVIAAGFIAAAVRWQQVVLLAGFAAAVFLVAGSNARGPQLVLPCLFALLLAVAFVMRGAVRRKALILLAVGLVAIAYSSSRMIEPNRLIGTVRELLGLPPLAQSPGAVAVKRRQSGARVPNAANPNGALDPTPIDFENLSTGRESLLLDSLQDVAASPLVGNGFAAFGRVDRNVGARSERTMNRTAHMHYLTVLWKGGLVFFVPYMALLVAFWTRALKATRAAPTPASIVMCAGVISLFTVLSLTWDILLVPSAGALGFFLLGALSESANGPAQRSVGMGGRPVL